MVVLPDRRGVPASMVGEMTVVRPPWDGDAAMTRRPQSCSTPTSSTGSTRQRQHATKTSVIAAAVETWSILAEATPEFPFLGSAGRQWPVARRPLDRAQEAGADPATASGDPLDPSAILAAADAADLNHAAAVARFERVDEPLPLGRSGSGAGPPAAA
jgi:hypothetical protein